MSVVLAGRKVVLRDRVVEPGWVRVEGDRVVALRPGRPPAGLPATLLNTNVVVPGFVDLHVHGGGGGSFDDGDLAEAEAAVAFHRVHGTTSMMASLVAAPPEQLMRTVAALAPLVTSGVLLGLHLEGPWLSRRQAGAHDPALLRDPTVQELQSVLAAGGGAVRVVTLAPELRGALEAVRVAAAAGVVVAVGHTDASYDETVQAVLAGARLGTHLFNAMRPLLHREPGPVAALLESPQVTVELIADGVHVHPSVLRLVLRQVGADRVALITDAIAAAGGPDGEYQLGGLDVQVNDGTARLAGSNTIAGSTLTMDAAFRFAVQRCGASLRQASAMTSSTPAAVLGRDDLGAVAVGRRADLVMLDAELQVQGVMAAGRWVKADGGPAGG